MNAGTLNIDEISVIVTCLITFFTLAYFAAARSNLFVRSALSVLAFVQLSFAMMVYFKIDTIDSLLY